MYARIDARFTGRNRVDITTGELRGFSLNLAGHPKFARSGPLQLSVDGTALTTTTGGTVSLVRSASGWAIGKADRSATSKQPGLEGPIGEAIARRHVLVYGTADNPASDESQRRREIAMRAATWVGVGTFGGRIAVSPRVISAAQVRPSDVQTSDLILFGTRETNGTIAKLAGNLPMHLRQNAEGYGLLYVYPVNGRYVLVSSGRPWFSLTDPSPSPGGRGRGSAAANAPLPEGYDFLPPVQRPLTKMQDFLLFKGSPENIVAAGRFDQNWTLDPADAEKLRASGVITLPTLNSQIPTPNARRLGVERPGVLRDAEVGRW